MYVQVLKTNQYRTESSYLERYGLTGEVRRVSGIDKMLKEAERLGFKKCIIPENNKKLLKEKLKLDIIGVKNIKDAMKEVRLVIESKRKSHKQPKRRI